MKPQAKGPFEVRYSIDYLSEAIFAEFLALVLFEVFPMASNSLGERSL
jgi:hypothetical protein